MWYKIDIYKLALLLLPPILRKGKIYSFLKILVVPFVNIVTELYSYRKDASTKMAVNGQVIYIEKTLNDHFLLSNHDIYITDTNIADIPPEIYLYDGESGDFETYFFDADSSNITYLPDGNQNESLMFVVNIPLYLQEYNQEIINIIEFNKPAGRRYRIEYYEY